MQRALGRRLPLAPPNDDGETVRTQRTKRVFVRFVVAHGIVELSVICLAGTGFGATIAIVDVTDVDAPRLLADFDYGGEDARFAHQGWLTDDHATFLFGDELDELEVGNDTRTFLVDVTDLDAPRVIRRHQWDTTAIDHQIYLANGWLYMASYTAGVRIADPSRAAEGVLTEVAWFDVIPTDDSRTFFGAWSVYPWFDSGIVVVSNITSGLEVLRPTLPSDAPE